MRQRPPVRLRGMGWGALSAGQSGCAVCEQQCPGLITAVCLRFVSAGAVRACAASTEVGALRFIKHVGHALCASLSAPS